MKIIADLQGLQDDESVLYSNYFFEIIRCVIHCADQNYECTVVLNGSKKESLRRILNEINSFDRRIGIKLFYPVTNSGGGKFDQGLNVISDLMLFEFLLEDSPDIFLTLNPFNNEKILLKIHDISSLLTIRILYLLVRCLIRTVSLFVML